MDKIRALTKSRKKKVLIRNDGVYVISGIFCGAHGGRRLWRKQAEVSPVSNKSHKHALRAMWIDDCELWVKMHSRPDRWPLEAAKRLEARAHAVRSAGTLGRRRRHSAKTSGRADSLANQRFVNDQIKMDFTVLAVVLLLGVGIPLRNRRFRKRRMQKERSGKREEK